MKILSIETSCDETGISILEAKKTRQSTSFKILGNVLNSQIKIHAKYGGVFPALAKREHIKNLPILLERILKKTKIKEKDIDLIAVTTGPGLEPALWTGIVFAKELAQKLKVPVVPVNHMEGHILSVFAGVKKSFSIPKIEFPALSLLVSGGHTELVLIKNWRKYTIIGETLDDAAGEAFDKVARMLGLPYPGGPAVSKLAKLGRLEENHSSRGHNFSAEKFVQSSGRHPAESPQIIFSSSHTKPLKKDFPSFSLPRPMKYSKNFDFSFSGLKTAVLYLIRDLKENDPNILENEIVKQMIAKEFEDAVVETLTHKTKKAIEKYNIKTVIVAGGVSANKYLKNEMKKTTKGGQTLLFPNKTLSTDNALMIAIAGYFKFTENNNKTVRLSSIKADGNLRLN
ncbi:MAG: tRNA (adenosine(37)-N6)-threonylcarbamoyltransferase complex transferase subunit TsaD [bacterium]